MLVHIIVGSIVGFALLGTRVAILSTASEAASLRGRTKHRLSGSVCIGVQNTDTDHFLTDMQRHGAPNNSLSERRYRLSAVWRE